MLRFATIGIVFLAACFCSFSQKPSIRLQTDVLVVGGSTGGVAAGIQCARMGIRTLVVEQTSWLGGMLTAAGVSCTDGNHMLASGIWQEFREALYSHYRTRNLFTGWVSETCFEPSVGDSIFKSWAAAERNLRVEYNWYFDTVLLRQGRVAGALFKNIKGETLTVYARITIDASDLGDVYASAGEAYDLGMENPGYSGEKMAPGRYPVIQDLTWAAVLKDYGKDGEHTIPRPPHYDSTLYYCCCTDAPCVIGKPYSVDALRMLEYGRLPNQKFMLNWPAYGNDYYINVVNVKPMEREAKLRPPKEKTLGFIYFIQTRLGFANIGLAAEFPTPDQLPFIPYYREGRRLKGKIRLSVNHLTEPFNQPEKLYRTGISVGDYPVDHHHSPEKNAPAIDFPRVPSFNVPLGSLIPAKRKGLIVCEKGISVSNIVNGSTRLQPCVLLTGQAAGVLAAMCIRWHKDPEYIPVRAVQKELLSRKAYLMPYIDLLPNDPAWESVQRVGASGILKGTGKPEGWANKTFFYPDSSVTDSELAAGLHEFEPRFPVSNYHSGKRLTIESAWKMLQGLQRYRSKQKAHGEKTISGDDHYWQKILAKIPVSESRKGDQLITRKILAYLIDHLPESPFDRPVDYKGNFR